MAQNNAQTIITDPDSITRLAAERIAEHMGAQRNAVLTGPSKGSISAPAKKP